MRLPIVLISSVFVLAGMSIAIPVEREDMLVTRFADSGFLADVEARAYGDGPELYGRGGGMSKLLPGRNKDSRPKNYKKATNPYQRIPPSPTHLTPYQPNRNIPPPGYPSSRRDPVMMSNTRQPQRQGFRAEFSRHLKDMAIAGL